jgi:diguanylate cyclase (GGDEF)-like protein
VELEEGHPARALESLNEILDHGGADMFTNQATSTYLLRARAHAELRQYPAAYADMDEYARRKAAEDAADRDRNAAVQRALFDTDRQVAHSLQLQRELGFSHEREQQEAQRNLVLLIGGAVSLGLLLYIAIASLRHRNQLEKLANYDGLTELPNRRFTAQFAGLALTKARESDIPLTIGLLDLDHFKDINDLHGHAVGDSVLRIFAQILRKQTPPTGSVGRWGGEEFLLVLPDIPLDKAVDLVERLREAALEIRLPGTPDLRVRFSAGLASRGTRNLVLDEIIANADAALYAAKKDGRDLTCVDGDSYVAPSAAYLSR